MTGETLKHVRGRYLDLLEHSILNSIHGESVVDLRLQRFLLRLRHPYLMRRGATAWPSRAHSMIGSNRMRNVRELVERTLNEGIPGDYIETGVWRGGACIMMRGVLESYGVRDRRVFCADSSRGYRGLTGKTIPLIVAIGYSSSVNWRFRKMWCRATSEPMHCWTTKLSF